MKKPDAHQPPTVAIALMAAFILSAAFIGMTAVVLPGVLLMVVAGFGLMLFFVAQYFLWARWMFPIVQRWEMDRAARDGETPTPTDKPV